MTIKVSFSQAKENFSELCDRVIDEGEIVKISRKGKGQSHRRDVVIISAAELNSLLETLYLLRSPNNAKRLLDALDRAQAQTTSPSLIEDLRKEVGLNSSSSSTLPLGVD